MIAAVSVHLPLAERLLNGSVGDMSSHLPNTLQHKDGIASVLHIPVGTKTP